MVKLIKNGDIFSGQCMTLTNPVNCVGVMGAGLAKEFKKRFPAYYENYRLGCKSGEYKPGDVKYYSDGGKYDILSACTKDHWKDPSKLEYIEDILKNMAIMSPNLTEQPIGIPKLGCGLGGLDFENKVLPLIIKYLEPLDNTYYIYV